MKISSAFLFSALAVAFAYGAVAHAQSMGWGEEYAQLAKARESLPTLQSNAFGENVNLYDGATIFKTTDVSLPGNSDLPVELTRTWDLQNQQQSQLTLGDWEIDVPNLNSVFLSGTGWPGDRCTQATAPPGVAVSSPPNYAVVQTWQFWSGYHLEAGDAGNGLLLSKTNDPKLPMPSPSLGATSPWVTKDGWRFACLPNLQRGNGEGFVGISPNGVKYTFDWAVQQSQRTLIKRGVQPNFFFIIPRVTIRIYATKIEDRHGNWVRYEWQDDRLQRIYSNDGREIVLAYDAQGRLASASANGRTWSYAYAAYPISQVDQYYLSQVDLPDGSRWRYDASAFVRRIVYKKGAYDSFRDGEGYLLQNFGYCNFDRVFDGGGGVYAVTHPSGARAEYQFSPVRHGRKNVPENCMDAGDTPKGANNFYPLHCDVLSIISKRITGPGLSQSLFQYAYAGIDPGYAVTSDPSSNQILNATPVPNFKTVTVTYPDGSQHVNVFGRDYGVNDGQLLRGEIFKSGVSQKVETYQYVSEVQAPAQSFPATFGSPLLSTIDSLSAAALRPIVKTTITQAGDAFATEIPSCAAGALCFDAFGRPTTVRKSSTLGTLKTDVTEYQDDFALWVLGQHKRGYNSETGVTESEVTYNAMALPWKVYRFGKLQQTLTYNADGTLATAADGAGNTATYSGWKRGIPQSILNPDATTQSATVDDNGWITSVTDENGYVTGYGYDAMGRMASIVHPTGDTLVGGATAYHSTWANYRALTDTDWKPSGVSTGQWRKLEGTGDHIAVTYYDAMWRPVLTNEYDQNNITSTLRAVRTEYDTSGRKSFESYPASVIVPGSTGIRTFYDALDRVTRVEQDSELDVLATTTEYLAGLKTRVTNPRGQQTTTSFLAWDQPGYDLPILSEQPEGKVIQIARHPQFGWPLSMTQRNAANTLSQTRRYVYDGNAQLCKTIEPETGATVTGYDAAGNPVWSASGLDATTYGSTTDCQYAAANASGRATTRTYDARNRLSQLSFPDGRGNQIWTYTPDGKPASVTAYNGPGNTLPVVMAYTYNHRRLLTGESVSQTGSPAYTWTIGNAYDAYGNLASQTYPTGLTVDYAPNPLGQATKAGSYATGAQYYPNGALKQFTYGNGILHSMTQNLRQLPSQVTSGGVTNYTYNYDANGNITNIWDLARGDNYSRWMTYDNLDRLTSAGSASFGGDAWHRFTYDALDNLKSWKLAGVKDYADYVYDAQNRLSNIRNTANATVVGLGYDLQGNVINKNGQGYDFDYGNRLRTLSSKESYRYDGLGRRVQTTATDGSKTTLWQYTQAGQMLFSSDWDGATYANQKTHENVYLAGSIVATIDHNWPSNAVIATKYQHTDALGSPVAVTNAAGTVTERNDYEPYGAVIGKPTYSGIGYTGHVMDGGTGLTYMQQRYYDESIGIFLSVDPVAAYFGAKVNFNRYRYADDNPYGYLDPDGRQSQGMEILGYVAELFSSNELTRRRYAQGKIDGPTAISIMQNGPGPDNDFIESVRADLRADAAGLERARKRGISRAWSEERELVRKTGAGSRPWTVAEIETLLKKGYVPGYDGHHINNVNDFPEMAADPSNVTFLDADEHLAAHGGNWRNRTQGDLVARTGRFVTVRSVGSRIIRIIKPGKK
ncbi:MAG: RHS repeat-associated core domain-containing protein [Lysobacteraceae bacterium]